MVRILAPRFLSQIPLFSVPIEFQPNFRRGPCRASLSSKKKKKKKKERKKREREREEEDDEIGYCGRNYNPLTFIPVSGGQLAAERPKKETVAAASGSFPLILEVSAHFSSQIPILGPLIEAKPFTLFTKTFSINYIIHSVPPSLPELRSCVKVEVALLGSRP